MIVIYICNAQNQSIPKRDINCHNVISCITTLNSAVKMQHYVALFIFMYLFIQKETSTKMYTRIW